jgi:bifunctional DNA-binding transcriptional regulator/antitoxin component of YhaV-PrlF toxin-antitoxin module
MERLVTVTKAYETGKPDSLIVIVPTEVRKLLGIRKGQRFAVKVDADGRLIYEPIEELNQK